MIDNIIGSINFNGQLPSVPTKAKTISNFSSKPTLLNFIQNNDQRPTKPTLTLQDYVDAESKKLNSYAEQSRYFFNNYEYERFIKTDKDNNNFFNWKKNPIFRDPRLFDNEDLNARNQSGLRQFINGASKALPNVINAFAQGLNPIPGTREGDFSQWIHEWSRELENSHPNFYSKKERENPFAISSILDGNFWGDKVLKNAGFTIGAIGGVVAWDAAISAMSLGSGTAPATAIAIGKFTSMLASRFSTAQKIINGVNEANLVGKTIKSSITAYEGLKNLSTGQKVLTYSKLGYLNYVGSNAEASIEGFEGLESLNEKLIDDFTEKNGRKPNANEYRDLKDIARSMANTRYAINLPLLMITNAIEFGSLFTPSKLITTGGVGFGSRLATDATGQVFRRGFKDFSKLEKAGYLFTNSLTKNFVAESFQEGAQYSIEKATEDLGFKKYQNPDFRVNFANYMQSQAIGIGKTFSETEGLESMLIGGLTGAITTGISYSYDKLYSKKTEKENKILDETIADYNTLSKENIINGDSFKEFLKKTSERDIINFDGTLTHLTLEAQIQKAIEDKNIFAFKALQHDKLFNLVSLATKLDKLDAFKLKIDQLKQLSSEEIAKEFGIENLSEEQFEKFTKDIDKYIDLTKDKVDQMADIISTVNEGLLNKFDPQKDPVSFKAFNDLKTTFAYQLSNIEDIKGRLNNGLDDLISMKENPLTEQILNTLIGKNVEKKNLILDDFTKNFITETGFDLSLLNDKYINVYVDELKNLNSEITYLTSVIELDKSSSVGYKTQLNEKKKELKALTDYLTELSTSVKQLDNTLKLRKDLTHQENIDGFKNLFSTIVKREMSKDKENPMSLSKADEIVEAIADLNLLNSSLKLFIDSNNKFQTSKGQEEYIKQYTTWQKYSETKMQEAIRKSNFETLLRTPEESKKELSNDILENLQKIEEINVLINEINEKLSDENVEDKEELEKKLKELIKYKAELIDQNKKLQIIIDKIDKVENKDLLAQKEEIEYSIDQLEQDIENRKQAFIKNGASESEAEELAIKEFNESENKVALDTLYAKLDEINKQIHEESSEEKSSEEEETFEEETSPEEITPVETTTVIETPIEVIEEKTTSSPITEESTNEKIIPNSLGSFAVLPHMTKLGEKPMINRFNNFLNLFNTFDNTPHHQNLNAYLEQNKLQFTLIESPDELFTEEGDYFDLAHKDKKSMIVALTDLDGNLVKVDESNELTEDGYYIISPISQNDQRVDTKNALPKLSERVKKGEKIPVNVFNSFGGRAKVLGERKKSVITSEMLDNLNLFLEIPNDKESRVFNGFHLMSGQLYLGIKDEKFATTIYLNVDVAKLGDIKYEDKLLSQHLHEILTFTFENLDTVGNSAIVALNGFLNSIFYIENAEKQPVQFKVGNDIYQIKVDFQSDDPKLIIEKNSKIEFEFSKNRKDKVTTLQNLFKLFNINTTYQDVIQIPRIKFDILGYQEMPYVDFLAKYANPTVEYTLDFSSENPFNYKDGKIHFAPKEDFVPIDEKLDNKTSTDQSTNAELEQKIQDLENQNNTQSDIKPTEQKQIIPEQVQSELKADIERRRQEELDSVDRSNYEKLLKQQIEDVEKYGQSQDDRALNAVRGMLYKKYEDINNKYDEEYKKLGNDEYKKLIEKRKRDKKIKDINNYRDTAIKMMIDSFNEFHELSNKTDLTHREKLLLESYNNRLFNYDIKTKSFIKKDLQKELDKINSKYDVELAALEQKVAPKAFEAQDVTVKKDEKSNWTLTVNSDGTVLNKNTNKLLDERLDKNLINKAHLKSGYIKYEKVLGNNKKEYAVTEDGRVISLNKSSLGNELDTLNSSIAKDVLSKATIIKNFDTENQDLLFSEEKIDQTFGINSMTESVDNSTLVEDEESDDKLNEKYLKKIKNNNLDIIESSKLLLPIQSLSITNTDIERVKGLFPFEVNIDNLFDVANSDAWATFTQAGITLFKGATRADLYHEAWHNFSQLYLTKEEKRKLYNEVREKNKGKFFTNYKNQQQSFENANDLEIEEYIAREFSIFTETGKIEGNFPERKTIFQKILNFLKKLFSNETDLSLNTLFNNLYQGKVNPKNYSIENIMFGRLNSGINDEFNYNERETIFAGIDGLINLVLTQRNISETEIQRAKNREKTINNIYNIVEQDLIDTLLKSKNKIKRKNLDRILENWDEIKDAHFKSSIIFNKDRATFEFNTEGELVSKEINEDDVKGRNKGDFQEASESSVFDFMDSEVKSLIATLVDKDKKGIVIDPVFGLPRLVDFQKYVSLISEKLSNTFSFDEVEEVLKTLSKNYPPMKDLLERLTINESKEVAQLRVKFVTNLALAKRKLITTLYTNDKTLVPILAKTNKYLQIENDLSSYFFISPETKYVKNIKGENKIISPIDLKSGFTAKQGIQFLIDLGINANFMYSMSTSQQNQLLKDLDLNYLKNTLNEYLEKELEITDIFYVLKDLKLFKNSLIEANIKHSLDSVTTTMLNAEQKMENENVMWATIDKDLQSLLKANSINELIQNPNRTNLNFKNIDMNSSVLLKLLFDKEGNRTKFSFNVNNQNGINSEEKAEGQKTKNLHYIEKAINDISQFMNKNILTTMQLSNKSTYFNISLPGKLVEDEVIFYETMLNYLLSELRIIKEYDSGNKELTKLKKLSAAIGEKNNYNLAIFKDILTKNPQNIINEFLKTGQLSKDTQKEIIEEIRTFFQNELNETVTFLGKEISSLKPMDKSPYSRSSVKKEDIVEDYIRNQFVMNVELSKIVFGNPYLHKDPYKRIAGATSSKRNILADDRTLKDFQLATTITQKSYITPLLLDRLKLKEIKFNNIRQSNKEVRFITFKDRELPSKNYEQILKAVEKELFKTKKDTPEYNELLEKKKSIEKAYSNVNGSDAMGALTMDAWRKFLWLSGRWDNKLENIYEKTIKWDYHNRLLKKAIKENNINAQQEQFNLRKEFELNENEIVSISVLKYQYYGNVKNDTLMEKAFHKFQLLPLLPQLVDNKLWEQHLDRMLLEDVDYALFTSADKLEKVNADDFYNNKEQNSTNKIEDYTKNYKKGENSYNVRTGFLENLGEQVFMENGESDSLLFGSQVRKLLFITDDYSDLYEEFKNIIQDLTLLEKENLYNNAGLNELGEVTNKVKFIEFILKELDKKVVNYNVKEYLSLTQLGELKGSLDTNFQRQPIEAIINSVLQNKLVKQKMHGELMVQVSNVGFESIDKNESLRFYETELNQEGEIIKVRKMEVKIPLTGKYRNLLNLDYINFQGEVQGKIETRERLNDMIKRGLIDERSLTMIGYRIPTQEHNSIEVMIVQEFLDPISNLVVVPFEITAKAGSDFDIDKLNIFKPHISKNGKYIESKKEQETKLLTFIEQKLNQYENYINKEKIGKREAEDKLINAIFKDLLDLDYTQDEIEEIKLELSLSNLENKEDLKNRLETLSNTKNSYQNQIIRIFETVLLAPSNYLNLITPNSTSMFDEAISDIFEAKYKKEDYSVSKGIAKPKDVVKTSSLLPRHNWQAFKIFGEAGVGLGIAAVGNVFSQLIQKSNVNFTESYLKNFDIKFTLGDISSRKLSDGSSKATAYSQLINLLVDIANDTRVGYVNMGDKVIPIVNLMINFQIPIKEIIYFINQPIIVDYVNFVSKKSKSITEGEFLGDSLYSYLKFKGSSYTSSTGKGLIEELSSDKAEQEIRDLETLKEIILKDDSLLNKEEQVKEIDLEIESYTSEEIPFENSKETLKDEVNINDIKQLMHLSQFVQFEEIAKDFLKLQVTMNFDTTLMKNGFEAFEKESLFNTIKNEEIFTNLDELRNNTIISPLNQTKEIIKINEQLLPLANEKIIYEFLSSKISTIYAKKGNNFKNKFVRTFNNDFIMYLFQNMINRNQSALKNFNTIFANVLTTEDINSPNTFGKKLIEELYQEFANIKNNPEYEELFDKYLLLNRMFVTIENDIKNIGLSYFNKNADLQNSFINHFKELLVHPNLEIRNFMLKFAFMSFYQSGLNKSFISSTDIIPNNLFSPILEDIREQYFKEFNSNVKKAYLLQDFFNQMYLNNEFLRLGKAPKTEELYKKKKFNKTNSASYRFKDFESDIDNILKLASETEALMQGSTTQKTIENNAVEEELKLTEDQQKVSDFIQEFLNKPVDNSLDSFDVENMIMITGAGGTGKTFTITRAIKDFTKNKYVSLGFAAPTHNAKRELTLSLNDAKFNLIGLTNNQLFGIDYNPLSGKNILKDVTDFYVPPVWNMSVVILDEYSMLGGKSLELIKERLEEIKKKQGRNIKIIFSGDYGQIPSVKENKKNDDYTDGEITNLIYHNRKDKVIALTKNMRAKYSDVANQGIKLRSYIDRINDLFIYKNSSETFKEIYDDFQKEFVNTKEISENVNVYTNLNKEEWINNYLDSFKKFSKENLKFGVIVNYNNSDHIKTIQLNKYIRDRLFNTNERFVEGDLLIMNSNEFEGAEDENGNQVIIGKEERLMVKKVQKIQKQFKFNYRQKGVKGIKTFGINVPVYELTVLNDSLEELTLYSLNSKNKIIDYFKDNSILDISDLNLFGDISPNKSQTYIYISKALADLDYGYVVNSHKVQGSSYGETFIEEDNILTAQNFKELLQLLYTAYTRSKFKTHVKLNNPLVLNKLSEFVPIDSTSQQSEVNTVEQIYSEISKYSEGITQSKYVILPKDVDPEADNVGMKYTTAIEFWRKIVPEAMDLFNKSKPLIVAFRGNAKKTFLENYKSGTHTVGNPFDWRDEKGDRKQQGIISTKKFIEWMITGNNFGNEDATEQYRQAVITDIKSGKIKEGSILYYEEKGYATHATALDYLINKYDWNKQQSNIVEQSKELFTIKKAKNQLTFRKKPLKFVDNIKTTKDKPVALRNTGNEVLINEKLLLDKYNEKAWLKSATQKDGSKSIPLNENEFNSFNEFLTFVLLHEIKHDTIKKQENETIGQYEDRINQAALEDLRKNYKQELKPKDIQITKEDTDKLPPCIG